MIPAGLQQRIQERLARGRAAATERLASAGRATIRRPGPPPRFPDPNGEQVRTWTVIATNEPFRLRRPSAGQARTASMVDVDAERAAIVGHLRWDFLDLRDGDLIEVTAGRWAGRVFEAGDTTGGDQDTALRLLCHETVRPTEWG